MLDDIHTILDALKLRHARAAVAERLRAAQKEKPSYSAFRVPRQHAGNRKAECVSTA